MYVRGAGWRRAIATAAIAVAAALVLAGCTGGGKQPATGSSAAAGPSTAAGASTAAAAKSSLSRLGAVGTEAGVGANSGAVGYQVVPASDRAQQAALMRTNCENPVAGVTCVYAPSGPLQHVLGQYQLLGHPYPVCEPSGFESVSRSDTSEVSNSLGVSVSVEVGNMVKQAWEGSFSETWTQSQTTELEDELELPPYTWGYMYRAAPMLRTTGDVIIRSSANAYYDKSASYQLVGVSFDVPDTAPGDSGKVALASRPMTAAEKSAQCSPQAIARRKAGGQ